jgi:glycosyltransferase involved in cell wall biosynthesis
MPEMNSRKSEPNIVFTVSNDLVSDQRMERICSTLAKKGAKITLIGRLNKNSLNIDNKLFKQIRLKCFINKGFAFYFLLNLRLFLKLLFTSFDIVCGIDLDTILPCILVAKLKGKKVYYDAHEYFTESEEIAHRPKIKTFWTAIERFTFKHVDKIYTVTHSIADLFFETYDREIGVIRNFPYYNPIRNENKGKYLLYQGALNRGRGLERLLVSMVRINTPLYLAGDGDIKEKLVKIAKHLRIEDKVHFLGNIVPSKLKEITNNALIGINLLDINSSISYKLSLGNKTLDYIQAELPSICIDFIEYKQIADKYETSFLIHKMETEEIVNAINDLISNSFNYNLLRTNCQLAKKELCWEMEMGKLLEIYGFEVSKN